MRIFIISRGYPSEKYVTNGIFEFDQAKALASLGNEVVFLALDLRSFRRKRKFGRESFRKSGVNIEAVNIPCGKLPKKLLRAVRAKALSSLYKQCVEQYGKPDVIHAHFQEIGYTTAKVLKNESVPLVLTEHLSKLNDKVLQTDVLATGKETYHYFDKIIAVGDNLKKSLKDNFSADSVVIPNIVDTDSFDPDSFSGKEKNTEEFRFISVGSLIKRKQMNLLIDAFARFHQKHRNSKLDIFGDGAEKENLQNQINGSSLQKCVVLHGASSRSVIAEYMARCDCFALASDVETFGVVYIEAMAMGLPVIAVKSGGPENFVTPQNGILVEPHSCDALLKAMNSIYENIENFNPTEIRNTTLAEYSPKAVALKIELCYKKLLSDKEAAQNKDV